DFIRDSDFALEPWTLRVHDIEYVASDKVLAISYENFDKPSRATQLAVSIIRIDDRTLEPAGQWKTIFLGELLLNVPTYQGLSGGGRLAFKSPNTLYLTAGDYNQDNAMFPSPKVAQDVALSFGKIIEINLHTEKHRIFSLGHRNPQGLLVTDNG